MNRIVPAIFLVFMAGFAESEPLTVSLHPGCNLEFPCDIEANETPLSKVKLTALPRKAQVNSSIGVNAESSTNRSSEAIEGRPHQCPVRSWCGCWLAQYLGLSDRSLWLAERWVTVGRDAGGPKIGAIVVWRHHVGKITAVDGSRIKVLSGNDGRAVRDRWRSTVGVLAYRLQE